MNGTMMHWFIHLQIAIWLRRIALYWWDDVQNLRCIPKGPGRYKIAREEKMQPAGICMYVHIMPVDRKRKICQPGNANTAQILTKYKVSIAFPNQSPLSNQRYSFFQLEEDGNPVNRTFVHIYWLCWHFVRLTFYPYTQQTKVNECSKNKN